MTDGVSVVAASWQQVFEDLGWDTITVAGDGPVDRLVSGLELEASSGPDIAELRDALADVDLVVAENILTIPLNLPASRALIDVLTDRPAILHHHDPPWQRSHLAHIDELPPDDPAWVHVTINRFTEREFAERGLETTTIYNGFDTGLSPGRREVVRDLLNVTESENLFVHPVRAIERKNVPGAIALCEALDATYWLPGPAEDGYQRELDRILASARCRVLRNPMTELASRHARTGSQDMLTMSDAYAACDLVVFPSLWEGFGNPPIEAAIHRRPVAVGDYPAATELRELGFDWLDPKDPDAVAKALANPPESMLTNNAGIVEQHLSLAIVTERVKALLDTAGLTL